MRDVRFFFDFISPYSWFALRRAEAFSKEHAVRWLPRPVVLGALLSHHGLVGPVETEAKRRYSLHDVSRIAHASGLTVEGPPRHPFRSLEALRTQLCFADDPRALRLAVRLADCCWAEGRDLEDLAVLRAAVEDVGLDPAGLDERIRAEPVKRALRETTEEALAAGVFGVPSFVHEDSLFWGHDRMDSLAAALDGIPPEVVVRAERMLARPAGLQRKR